MTAPILVTGGAGYVGSHVCKALRRAGYEPVTYDDLSRGHRWAVKWGPLEEGDVADAAQLAAVLDRHRPIAAMHFAALTYADESVDEPARYYGVNLAGSWTLLEALRRAGVRNIVFSSTCAVYGASESPAIPETAAFKPESPYGFSKLAIERMLGDYARAYGMNTVALRYFNAAGADPDGEIGEAHEPETHLIPLALEVAAGRRSHIDIFGDDYATPDGTCIRDYIHVADLADAHVLALRALLRDGGTHAFNLGTGRGHSVREIVDAAARVTGCPIPTRTRPRRPGDPARAVADASLAARELGWAPRYRTADPILESAWRWLRKPRPA